MVRGRARAGETILIHGASGGVSSSLYEFNSIQSKLEQAVVAHACHGHTLQLSTGLSV